MPTYGKSRVMPVIPVNKVVDEKRLVQKIWLRRRRRGTRDPKKGIYSSLIFARICSLNLVLIRTKAEGNGKDHRQQ
jgi:hypothetical protein